MDILPSLQTGLINAVPLPPSIALAGQVDAVAPHMLDLDWAPLVGAAVITKKTWDAIPAEGRDALRKVGRGDRHSSSRPTAGARAWNRSRPCASAA